MTAYTHCFYTTSNYLEALEAGAVVDLHEHELFAACAGGSDPTGHLDDLVHELFVAFEQLSNPDAVAKAGSGNNLSIDADWLDVCDVLAQVLVLLCLQLGGIGCTGLGGRGGWLGGLYCFWFGRLHFYLITEPS